MIRYLRLLQLMLQEQMTAPQLARESGSTSSFRSKDTVSAWDTLGREEGHLLSLYRFNAMALTRLLPKNGVVLDLGVGSGHMMAYLAEHRPDIRVIGMDLSEQMLRVARETVRQAGLADRISLIKGDLCKSHELVSDKVDLVSCILTGHLLNAEQLEQFFSALKVLKFRNNCSIWIFDYLRPRHEQTAEVFAETAHFSGGKTLRRDIELGLKSAYSLEELAAPLDSLGIGPFEHYSARLLPIYQIHRLRSEKHYEFTRSLWKTPPWHGKNRANTGILRFLFPKKAID